MTLKAFSAAMLLLGASAACANDAQALVDQAMEGLAVKESANAA